MSSSIGDAAHWNQKGIAQNYAIGVLAAPPTVDMLSRALPGDIQKPFAIFDNASGPGTVTESILNKSSVDLADTTILCGDISSAMVDSVKEKITNDPKWKIVTAQVIDAQETKLPDNSFTHVFINFAVVLVPRPLDVLKESLRILKPGGYLAFTTWRSSGWVPDAEEAIRRVPGAPAMVQLASFTKKGGANWDEQDWVDTLLTKEIGFAESASEAISYTAQIPGAEKWVNAAMTSMKPILMGNWPEDVEQEYGPKFPGIYQGLLEEKYGKDEPIPVPCSVLVTVARKAL